jgi:hypothetical protein
MFLLRSTEPGVDPRDSLTDGLILWLLKLFFPSSQVVIDTATSYCKYRNRREMVPSILLAFLHPLRCDVHIDSKV